MMLSMFDAAAIGILLHMQQLGEVLTIAPVRECSLNRMHVQGSVHYVIAACMCRMVSIYLVGVLVTQKCITVVFWVSAHHWLSITHDFSHWCLSRI